MRLAPTILMLLLPLAVTMPAGAQPPAPSPILVTGMLHIDPIGTPPDTAQTIQSYLQHRSAIQWYLGLASQTGLRLSAQMTGVYAEACVRQGNAADFVSFMPGGVHHLGTHLHANVKTGAPYGWRQIAQSAYADPDSTRRVFSDNMPWVNEVFERNGFTTADNWFLHGTHASYPGMEEDLWCLADPGDLPYDNCFAMAPSQRGAHWVHRGGYAREPGQTADESYVKLGEVGGIVGVDAVHGPEGMVWGTVRYQKRDFLRVYLEWRESARGGEEPAVRFFNWMIHPYQLVPGYVGTDGRSPRASIAELVDWLRAGFIEHTDETGFVVARFANASEIRQSYDAWRASHPAEDAALQALLAAGGRPLRLPAIFDRLESAYYSALLPVTDPDLAVHRLTDRTTGAALLVVWSRAGDRPAAPSLSGSFSVLHGDGTVEHRSAGDLVIGEEPLLLEPEGAVRVEDGARPVFSIEPLAPNPARDSARLTFTLARAAAARVRVYDSAGRLVARPVEKSYDAGRHVVVLPTAGWPAGIYWCRVEVEGAVSSAKLLVLR